MLPVLNEKHHDTLQKSLAAEGDLDSHDVLMIQEQRLELSHPGLPWHMGAISSSHVRADFSQIRLSREDPKLWRHLLWGSPVEYFSDYCNSWVAARVYGAVDESGRVDLDIRRSVHVTRLRLPRQDPELLKELLPGDGVEHFDQERGLWQPARVAQGPADGSVLLEVWSGSISTPVPGREPGLLEPTDLLRVLVDTDIRLVRGEFLCDLVETGRVFPRRQEAEAAFTKSGKTALVTVEEVRQEAGLPVPDRYVDIVAVSHCWETREHPDPFRHQLKEIFLQEGSTMVKNWYFIDYMSLYQYKRDAEQQRCFEEAMKHVHVLYAHECTRTLTIKTLSQGILTNVPDDEDVQNVRDAPNSTGSRPPKCFCWQSVCQLRRWRTSAAGLEQQEKAKALEKQVVEVFYEPAKRVQGVPLSQLRRTNHTGCQCSCARLHANTTDYGLRGWCIAEKQWSATRGNGGSEAPLPPAIFQRKLEHQNIKFTHRQDLDSVLYLQGKVFLEKASICSYQYVQGFPEEEIRLLGGALPHYVSLQKLSICRSWVGDEGCETLAAALQQNVALLEDLTISHNDMSEQGLVLLVQAVAHKDNLQRLNLESNDIQTAGFEALAAVCEVHPALETLVLSHEDGGGTSPRRTRTNYMTRIPEAFTNKLSADAASFLASALQANRTLTFLELGGNCIEDPAAVKHLIPALEASGSLQRVDITGNEVFLQNCREMQGWTLEEKGDEAYLVRTERPQGDSEVGPTLLPGFGFFGGARPASKGHPPKP
eukprot:s56_g5.t1